MGFTVLSLQIQASNSAKFLKVEAIVAKGKVKLEFASIYYINQVCLFV